MAEKNIKGTPTDLSGNAVEEISSNLRRLLADVFYPLREDEEFPLAYEWAPLS